MNTDPNRKLSPPRHYLKRTRPSGSSNRTDEQVANIVGDLMKHNLANNHDTIINKYENMVKKKHPIYQEIDNMLTAMKGFELRQKKVDTHLNDNKADDNKMSYMHSTKNASNETANSEDYEKEEPAQRNQRNINEKHEVINKDNVKHKHFKLRDDNFSKVNETTRENEGTHKSSKDSTATRPNTLGSRKVCPAPFLRESLQPGVYVPYDAILNNKRNMNKPKPTGYPKVQAVSKGSSGDEVVPQHQASKCKLEGQCNLCTLEINENASKILENLKGMLESDMKSYKNMKYKLLEENCTQTDLLVGCEIPENDITKTCTVDLDTIVEESQQYKVVPKCFMVELNPLQHKQLENLRVHRKSFVDDESMVTVAEISSNTRGDDVSGASSQANYGEKLIGKHKQETKIRESAEKKMQEIEEGMFKLEEKLSAVTKMDRIKDFAIDQLRAAWQRLIEQWDEMEQQQVEMSEGYKYDRKKFEIEKLELQKQVHKNKEQLTESYNLVERAHLRIMDLEKSEQTILEELANLKKTHDQQKGIWQKKINDTALENQILATTITKLTEIRSK